MRIMLLLLMLRLLLMLMLQLLLMLMLRLLLMLLLLLMLRMIYRNDGGQKERKREGGVRCSTYGVGYRSMPVPVSVEEGTNTGKGRCVITVAVVLFYTVPTVHLTPGRRKRR